VAGQGRQSKAFTFTLSDANRQLLATPNTCDDRPPYQIRFYCAKYNGRTDHLKVEFPGICELKVNDSVIPGHVSTYNGGIFFLLLTKKKKYIYIDLKMFKGKTRDCKSTRLYNYE
jgi:hypothetical protein